MFDPRQIQFRTLVRRNCFDLRAYGRSLESRGILLHSVLHWFYCNHLRGALRSTVATPQRRFFHALLVSPLPSYKPCLPLGGMPSSRLSFSWVSSVTRSHLAVDHALDRSASISSSQSLTRNTAARLQSRTSKTSSPPLLTNTFLTSTTSHQISTQASP